MVFCWLSLTLKSQINAKPRQSGDCINTIPQKKPLGMTFFCEAIFEVL
ncbi:hypothetical protein N44_02964 [Microcystis aeruginosa NIES-44]|uniref:Uncharacterized protein n=1 Tax=Microcystis aeruginosa NIES-44 TaxID=449439 RepID=A0A0A1VXU4_MICAE|nr:hypothetical protein N44_02964 [Microcystis aeruginosa NIES-44]